MIEQATTERLKNGQTLFINGEWKAAGDTVDLYDPSRPDTVTAMIAAGAAESVDAAFAAASTALEGWSVASAQARAQVLLEVADRIEAEIDSAAKRLTGDMGKAIKDAKAEVSRGVAILRYFAGDALQPSGETYPSADPDTTLFTMEEPVGVVGAITPWNFPVAIPLWKIAPAIVFGNTVVWKPATAAAGSAVFLCEAFSQAGLPDGVLNLVTGSGGALSEAITSASSLGALTFTGSGPTGMKIQTALAQRTVKTQFELGGKNPAIVLADADLDDAALQIARGAMFSSGQRCTATSRVFVESGVFEEFSRALVDVIDGFTVGDPYDPGTDVGPVASDSQHRTVNEYLDLAREESVSFLCGETKPDLGDGYYVAPTVLADVDLDSRLMTEEIFGPVLCLVSVEGGFEEALKLANDTEFGLSSGVFTSSLEHAMDFARKSESGLIHVNRETAGVEPHVPFGGVKGSSNAQREQGTAARRFFTNTKTAYVRTPRQT